MVKGLNWVLLGLLALLMLVADFLPVNVLGVRGQATQNTSAEGGPQAVVVRLGESSSFDFSPPEVTIEAGQTVTWQGNFATHPLVSDTWLWDAQWKGSEFSYTFAKPGTYRYYCQLHGGPQGVGMSGIVIVK
jgi:plastocyanin